MEVKGQVHPAGQRSAEALWPRGAFVQVTSICGCISRGVQLTVNYVEFSRQLFLFSPLSSLNSALDSAQAFYFSKWFMSSVRGGDQRPQSASIISLHTQLSATVTQIAKVSCCCFLPFNLRLHALLPLRIFAHPKEVSWAPYF